MKTGMSLRSICNFAYLLTNVMARNFNHGRTNIEYLGSLLKHSKLYHFSPFNDTFRVVQIKDFERCCANKRFGNHYTGYICFKMFCSGIRTRIEKTNWQAGVVKKGVDVCAFTQIADLTRIGEVVCVRCAPMLETDNVVNMKSEKRINGRETTILATMVGAFCDQATYGFGNILAHTRSARARARILASRISRSSTI